MSDSTESEVRRNECAVRWVTGHGDYLFRYARVRVGDAAHAEDLVQETLLTALRKRKEFLGKSSERTWLTGILRFKILEFYRAEARSRPPGPDEPPEPTVPSSWFDAEGHWNRATANPGLDWEPNPREQLDMKEFQEVLHECLRHVPDKARAAFIQRELEARSPSEIQSDLRISESNLWVLLHRARNQLRQCLQAHGDFTRPQDQPPR